MKFPWSLVAAVNSDEVLQRNLLASEEHRFAQEVITLRGYRSASEAYNAGIYGTSSEILVFAHQDVFLPQCWAEVLSRCLEELSLRDPNWGVAGIVGITSSGQGVGFAYSTGLRRFVGRPFQKAIQVRTLDEILLIIRRSSGLEFDRKLPGFHLYGVDICLEAERRGMRNYVVPCFVLHNSNGINWLPLDFWKGYFYLRKKWKDRLPIVTTCTNITKSCLPIFKHYLERIWLTINGGNKPGSRVENPSRFFEENIKVKIAVGEKGKLG